MPGADPLSAHPPLVPASSLVSAHFWTSRPILLALLEMCTLLPRQNIQIAIVPNLDKRPTQGSKYKPGKFAEITQLVKIAKLQKTK